MALRRPKHVPIRSCIVCRQTSEKRTLLRVVRQPEKSGGSVVADPTGKLSGRGAYVCATEKCIALAQKQKRFERALAVLASSIESDLFEKLITAAAEYSDQDKSGSADSTVPQEVLVDM